MTTNRILEIACFNVESAILAQAAGADRIEFCENYKLGGITPSQQAIAELRKQIHIPLFVMIRPRGGDFIYSAFETEKMKQSIFFSKDQDVNGLVFGALTTENKIDIKLCEQVIQWAAPLPVTFHRAIDECPNTDEAIEQLIELGFKRVLTSGGAASAVQGLNQLLHLQQKYGDKIGIVAGGGIRASNLRQVFQSRCSEYHSAAITGNNELPDTEEIKKMKNLFTTEVSG